MRDEAEHKGDSGAVGIGARRCRDAEGVNEARLDRVRALIEAPLLVTSPVNVLYLTGLHSTNAAVIVGPDRACVFTDFRYLQKAREGGAEVVEVPRNIYTGIADHIRGRIEFEAESLTYAQWAVLERDGLELVPRNELVVGLRAVKEDAELEAISRAAAITNECFERLAEQPFVGRTEREVAWWLESLMHELGADEAAFPTIVAAGPGGALPHASTGARVIEAGTTVVVDAAAKLGDYCSDCTRTFAAGELPDELARSYEVCRRAQQAALAAVRPGAGAREVDAVARDLIAAEGLGDLFGHGLGHGLGLEVHELPRLRPESDDVLPAGGVCTVEPGIYHPGLGGIRIEDLVIIGEDGPDVLTTFTKELVAVD
jgi:Xaa-Pro aminopeptidase